PRRPQGEARGRIRAAGAVPHHQGRGEAGRRRGLRLSRRDLYAGSRRRLCRTRNQVRLGMTDVVTHSESTSEAMTEPVLELRRVNKSFGPVHVLHDVDFAVRAGEVTALVGDNGAGKSTLVKCIAGIHPVDSGTIRFQGREVSVRGPKDAADLGIEVVYQDLALADNLDVVQNMCLGRERGSAWLLDEAGMEEAARRTLASLSVRTVKSVRTPVSALSGGQRQTVAIAKSVLWESSVVLLDEPTAALGVAQTRQVLDLVRRLAEQGLGVVLISHNMADVFEVSDRIAVLYLGRMVGEVRTKDGTHGQVVELITAGRSGDLGLARPENVAL